MILPFTVRCALVLAAASICAPTVSAQIRLVKLDGIHLHVSMSRTAEIFHFVDQMSNWDSSVHHSYVRWADRVLALTDDERDMLGQHASMRKVRGWGGGFEQAFYTDLPITDAARKAVREKLLTEDEATNESRILQHFAPRVTPYLKDRDGDVSAFISRLERESGGVSPTVAKLIRFSGTATPVELPVYLVPNPEPGNGGGGYSAGRLIVEISNDPDPMPVLLHEMLHSLLWKHKDEIVAAAASIGVGWSDLNEGIAHAFSPGLTDDAFEAETLAERIANNYKKGRSLADGYSQSKKFIIALILRPMLRRALHNRQTFAQFLPVAVAKLKTFDWQ